MTTPSNDTEPEPEPYAEDAADLAAEREALQAEGMRAEERAARAAREEEAPTRPAIQVEPSEPHAAADRAIEALRGDPDLYVRGGALVHVVRVPQFDAALGLVEGTPQIRTLPREILRERLTRFALWVYRRKDGWTPGAPSPPIVGAIHSRGEWPGLRPLIGITDTPVLRHDGSILSTPGYDASTGYLYQPLGEFQAPPEFPTLADARAARERLEDVFIDFQYTKPSGRSVPLAIILSLVARPAIAGPIPVFIFDAPTPGSGKSLQTNVCSILATGRRPNVKHFNADSAELDKVLSGWGLSGARFANFDNLDGDVSFGGAPLEMVATAYPRAEFRILGKNEIRSVEWCTVIAGSGNNVRIDSRDMQRRVLVARIESGLESPEKRPIDSYRHPERANRLEEFAFEHRHALIIDALTILRAYVLASRPKPTRPSWGSYGAWTNLVANAIIWAGGADPLDARLTADEYESPKQRAYATILRDWPRLDKRTEGLKAGEAIAVLWEHERERARGEFAPDGFDELREALCTLVPSGLPGARPDAAKLGIAFQANRGRVVGGLKFEAVGKARSGAARWAVCEATSAGAIVGARGAAA